MSPMPVKIVAGYVLTGGASTRMGRDKALLELAGAAMALRAARLLEPLVDSVTLIGPPEIYAALGLPVIPDIHPGAGPLGGIATAILSSRADWNLVLACDLPYLTVEWLRFLLARARGSAEDIILPESDGGPEPLCALYRSRAGAQISAALARGVRKVTDGLTGLAIDRIPPAESKPFDSAGRLFKNMNSPGDYEAARAFFERTKEARK